MSLLSIVGEQAAQGEHRVVRVLTRDPLGEFDLRIERFTIEARLAFGNESSIRSLDQQRSPGLQWIQRMDFRRS